MSAPEPMPSDADPFVSLIMVLYGKHDLARATLSSLAATVDVPAEVIVVDNASPDGAGVRLETEVSGARFVHSPSNLGYGTAADLGALHARGRYVVVLNSDLGFAPAWLSALVDVAEADPGVGSVAPLYVGPDGMVLDAGRLLGADANGYGYGDLLRPDAPEVSFRRRIDFGTAAALLVRREAFDAVGGFDPIFGLGYFEDTDLGFALQAAGYDNVFEPRSVVHHVGGGSFDHGLRRRQLEQNLPVFLDRWGDVLRGRPNVSRPPYDPHRELVLRDWLASERLLVLDRGGRYAASLADDAGRRSPRSLVTWASAERAPTGLGHDVEWIGSVGLRQWLEARRFHYSAVLADDDLGDDVAAWVDRSQPQARRLGVDEVEAWCEA